MTSHGSGLPCPFRSSNWPVCWAKRMRSSTIFWKPLNMAVCRFSQIQNGVSSPTALPRRRKPFIDRHLSMLPKIGTIIHASAAFQAAIAPETQEEDAPSGFRSLIPAKCSGIARCQTPGAIGLPKLRAWSVGGQACVTLVEGNAIDPGQCVPKNIAVTLMTAGPGRRGDRAAGKNGR